jgi:regulator of sigma E protease
VHELGHYWAAKRAGIHVEEFSIGMGPRLLKFTRNDTMYSLKLFPIGGSCRMMGDYEEESEGEEGEGSKSEPNPRAFNSKSVPWRMFVILGGGIMNIIFALILGILLSMFNIQQEPNIVSFSENSPALEAGLLEGDRITRLNGRRIVDRRDITVAMLSADGGPIDVRVNRNGVRHDFVIEPIYHAAENRWLIGIAQFGFAVGTFADAPEGYQDIPGVRRVGFFENFRAGVNAVDFYMRATFTGIGRLIRYGFNFDEIVGPIGIVDVVGDQVGDAFQLGGGAAAFWTLLNFATWLSVSLAIMNFLPIPALDGAHMVFLTIEAIRGKPVPPERQGMINLIGFVLLMGLALVVAYNDILRLF